MVTGIIVMVITLIAAYFTEETFHKDLNYVEAGIELDALNIN